MKPNTPKKSQKTIMDVPIIPGPADYFKPDRSKELTKKLYGDRKPRSLSRNNYSKLRSSTPLEINLELNKHVVSQLGNNPTKHVDTSNDFSSVSIDQKSESNYSRPSSNMFFARLKKPIYHNKQVVQPD